MRVETAIGTQIARLRETRQMSLTQLGEGGELGRGEGPAPALALALDTSVPALFLADADQLELPGATVSAEDYRGILLYADDAVPMDGVEELIVALHDIAE